MVVEFQKLHSNFVQKPDAGSLNIERRINKPHPNSSVGSVAIGNMHDMCVANKMFEKKTILSPKTNGLLSFKGHQRYDMLYKLARAIVDEDMPNRAWYLARRARFDKVAETAKKKYPVLGRLVTNKYFLKSMKFINDNALLSDAAIALLYTCCLRPASIAALPAKDKNEKQKNIYQIGHSISTGIIGFVTAFLIQTPIKDAFNKVAEAVTSKNASKYIKPVTEYLFKKENIEKTRTLLERSHQPITLPLKAVLTIYLVPKILKVFGLTKNQTGISPKSKAQMAYDEYQYFTSFKSKNPAFQNFSGGLKNGNK